MALSSKTFTLGLRLVGSKPKILLTNSVPVTSKIPVAYITGRASRTEVVEKPKPWPYKEKGFSNFHAFYDGTTKRFDENTKVIVVEGLPAIGKSALARSLAEELEMEYFPMVTSDTYYINMYGFDMRSKNDMLPPHLRNFDEKDFVKNPKSAKTIHLQLILWFQKLRQYMDALSHVLNTGQGVVLDRCVYTDTVFADTLLEMGYISKLERATYQKFLDRVMFELMKPHLIVYLDAPISVVESNLKKRGKGEEKVWNREMLEKLEYNYKHKYLKTMSEHAELLAYDWSSPGEAEVVVEDIERIDFDRFDIHDPKMADWRIKEEWDWSEKRWDFTTRASTIAYRVVTTPGFYDVGAICASGDDQILLEEVYENCPGFKYHPGYNADLGDKDILFTMRRKPNVWKDYGLSG